MYRLIYYINSLKPYVISGKISYKNALMIVAAKIPIA
jgi:hypothetical protein